MLSSISWASFTRFLLVACVLYYVFVFLKYYLKDFVLWLRRRRRVS